MSWAGLEGHDGVVERFRHALRHERLASTFLFVGPAGIGKRTFAVRLAQSLLCETNPEQDLNPCGHCPACQQVEPACHQGETGSHPDLEIVCKPKDRNVLPIELFIGDREHRMREGLCHKLSLKPFRGGRRVGIIDDADLLSSGQQESANCLLKTLEEPPPKSVLILIGTSEQKQLPTIRSRCQVIRFQPLTEDTIARLLVSTGQITDPNQARQLAALAGGSLAQAADLADQQIGAFRETLLTHLSQPDANSVEFSKTVGKFVEAAGKDAPPRRVRMTQLIGLGAEFYRQLLRSLSGASLTGDETLRQAVAAARREWRGDAEMAADCLDRCLEALAHVQANANQATLLECWLDELAATTHSGRGM
jgi:DNA polymerase III subunit delta'